MSNTWKPKIKVECPRCGWIGQRAVLNRACPCCDYWRPTSPIIAERERYDACLNRLCTGNE